jgi:sugar O-acyltransferase (sialic acid O-acetyltransferase NeuD family)
MVETPLHVDVPVQPLVVLGTHHFAPEVLDLVSETPGFRVEAFVENLDRERTAKPLEGLPVLWIEEAGALAATHLAVCALGTTKRRRIVEEAAALGFRFATVVHPLARVSGRSELGEGTIASVGVVVATRTRIGRHVILNRGALVGHDTEIGDFVTAGPGANVAGLCRIGHGAYLGIGCVIRDRVSIGDGAVVGAGAVVTEDVPANVQVTGVPARVVKEGVDGL